MPAVIRPTLVALGGLLVVACSPAAPAPASQPAAPTPAPKPTSPAVASAVPAASPVSSPAAVVSLSPSPRLAASPSVGLSPSPSASPTIVRTPTVTATGTATVAPTANAAGTAVGAATSAANVASTAVSASPMRIVGIQPGATDSTLTLANTSGSPVDLTNWSVRLGTTTLRLPANTVVPPNGQLVVHSSSGTSSASDVYLGQDTAALMLALQSGTTVSLVDASGNVVGQMTPPR